MGVRRWELGVSQGKIMYKKHCVQFLVIVFIGMYAVLGKLNTVHAQVRFPVPELGYCRDPRECYFYCQIPKNSPACWSYGKYIMQKDVLGDSSSNTTIDANITVTPTPNKYNISFPIAELGNCANVTECKNFCAQSQNQVKCHDFAVKKGILKSDTKPQVDTTLVTAAKTELRCDGADACKAFCQKEENTDTCFQFAVKHGRAKKESAPKKITSNLIAIARKELGCTDAGSCRAICEKPENQEKCLAWGKKQGLIKEELKEISDARQKLLTEAKAELGCDSFTACAALCKTPEDAPKCIEMYKKIMPPVTQSTTDGKTGTINGPGGCASENACREYCTAHSAECAGFNTKNLTVQPLNTISGAAESLNMQSVPPTPTDKVYLGPGGCKTEAECQAYCQSHPSDCPGFPHPTVPPSSTNSTTGGFGGVLSPTTVKSNSGSSSSGSGSSPSNTPEPTKTPTPIHTDAISPTVNPTVAAYLSQTPTPSPATTM